MLGFKIGRPSVLRQCSYKFSGFSNIYLKLCVGSIPAFVREDILWLKVPHVFD